MNTMDSVKELMHAIRRANPDIDTLVLEGVHVDKAYWQEHLVGPIKWHVIVTFIDGDGYTTDLFDTSIEALQHAENRLAKWVGQ